MQNNIIKYGDLAIECQPGITELHTDSLGLCTFVGFSAEGDAVIQHNFDNFTTIPELTWNLMEFTKPFEAETHVRYLKSEDLVKFHDDIEKIFQIELAEHKSMLYEYQATIEIKKVYNTLGGSDD